MPQRIKYALELNGITGAELARRAGIHKSSVTQYLQGEHIPSQKVATRLAEVLNVSPVWLLGYDVPITETEIPASGIWLKALNRHRFIQIDNTAVNLSHVIKITSLASGSVEVLLDTGELVAGNIVEQDN